MSITMGKKSSLRSKAMRLSLVYVVLCFGILISTTNSATNSTTPSTNFTTPSPPSTNVSTASSDRPTPSSNLSTLSSSNPPTPFRNSSSRTTLSISVPPSPLIPSAAYCSSEKGGSKELHGVFSWPRTVVGRRAIIACPYDLKKNASRRCVFKGDPEGFGGEIKPDELVSWGVVNAKDCPYRSKRSKDIHALSQKTLNSDNVNETSQQIKNLSSPGTTLQPGDIGNIATILEKIVAVKGTVEEVIDDFLVTVDNTLDARLRSILQSQQKTNSSSRIVEALNTLIETLTIGSENSFQRTLKNFAVDVSLVQPRSFFGLSFAGIINDTNIELLEKGLSDDKKVSPAKATTIRIPSTIFNESSLTNRSSPQKVIFALYKELKFFQVTSNQSETESSKRLNSYVIAGSIKALSVSNLRNPVEISFASLKPGDKSSTSCSFWNFTLGNWSQEGCEYRDVGQDGRIICSCNHLTNFAMLMDIHPNEETSHDRILGLISYIGCGLSLAGLVLTIITILVLKELRSKIPGQILLNFCIALSLTLIVFLAAAERSKTSSLASCRAAAIALHYFLLVAFMWMAIEAFNMYLAFVKVLPTYVPKFMLKCCVVAWGVPAVIVSITIGVALDDYGDDKYCRLLGVAFLVSFLAPILLILLGNTIAFVLILRSLLTSGSRVTSDRRTTGYQQVRQGVAIMVLLGLTWLFGILAINDAKLVFQYLFCIFNSLQGLCVFVFYCILSSGTKKQWRDFLRKTAPLRRHVGKLDSQDTSSKHGNNYTASSNVDKKVNSSSGESAFTLKAFPENTNNSPPYEIPVTDIEMGYEETGDINSGFVVKEDIPLNAVPENTRSIPTFESSPADFEMVREDTTRPKSEFVAKGEIVLKILHPGMLEYTVKNESRYVSSVEITLKNNTIV